MDGYQPTGILPSLPVGGSSVYRDAAESGDPVMRNRLIRKMAASYIRHQLYIGTKARAIGLEIEGCDLGETRFLAHDADGRISLSMLGLTGKGPTIDAALRHWCEIVEGQA